MLFALNKEGRKVYIDYAKRSEEYFCPCCGDKMILRLGDVKIHHFAHSRESICDDSWHYDMTEWHFEWQNKFPKEYQEIVKMNNGEKHRADILIEKHKVVIEFQHSPLSPEEFKERNEFYNKLGYKVVWIFDVEEQYYNDMIVNYKSDLWIWKHPRRTFDYFDYKNKMVELYLQLDTENTYLIKVTWNTDDKGLSRFATDGCEYDDLSIVNMFNDNKKSGENEYKLSELFDKMIELNQKDHTTYFFGCPISKTHQCASCNIDIPNSMYEEIMPCMECKYQCHSENYDEIICKKRFMDLQLDGNTLVKIESRDMNGFINKISFLENSNVKYVEIPTFKQNISKSIYVLWEEDFAVAVFKNIRNGYYVKISKNPREQQLKYRKVYGWFSKDKYSFSKESRELYGVEKQEWVVDWFRKN
ncbi:MAG: hypothetical protein IJD76_04755 [Bacilli bacterium]|nr:hypothetical protein [Bacilli bacterium]